MRSRKKILFGLLGLLVLASLALVICNKIIESASSGKLYTTTSAIPVQRTGILLGTARQLPGGGINPFYQYRIDAAAALIRAGKIRYLVISGDNSRKEYNEPDDMRRDLINLGIDSTIIYPDYAGFRTFDSLVRLKEIFGQDSVTVISQRFHNERALYLASTLGIEAIGFNARDVAGSNGTKVQFREKLARVKVFIDGLTGTRPKFLGKKIEIGN